MQIIFDESQTRLNLMRAFAGESQSRQRYYQAALIAQQQKLVSIERVFRFTAEQEERHAMVFWKFLKDSSGGDIDFTAGFPSGVFEDIQQLLDSSAAEEEKEYSIVYPDFARIAADEGFTDIASKFRMIAEIENTHNMRFKYYGDLLRNGKLFRDDNVEQTWMCLNCGHIHKGSEPPNECPVCRAAQGYFIREYEAAFTSSEM